MPVARLAALDYLVMAIYFVVVLGIGWALRRRIRTSTDFLVSGRSLPPWVTGLAFLSANLGAQEVIGMGASGAKYVIATSHFYWIGAIPAMVFVGIFMMPFYYGSRARSVPEYLKLRFDEKTRTLNAISFAAMTIFSSGVSMYAMGKLLNLLRAGEPFGEMAYLMKNERVRGADVTAMTDANIISVPTDKLARASDACRHKFDRAFMEILVERLFMGRPGPHRTHGAKNA